MPENVVIKKFGQYGGTRKEEAVTERELLRVSSIGLRNSNHLCYWRFGL